MFSGFFYNLQYNFPIVSLKMQKMGEKDLDKLKNALDYVNMFVKVT